MDNKKSKPNIEQFKSLCDKCENNKYVSKKGNDYIQALSNLFSLENKNDKPFTQEDIIQQPTLDKFNFSGAKEYMYICSLIATPLEIINDNRKNEKIITQNFQSDEAKKIFNKSQGVSYLLTCHTNKQEHIIKIGQTRTPFKKRLQSYNCGTVNNWRTASTTNIKILQSMLTTRLPFKLYIYDCSDEPYSIIWHNRKSVNLASPKSLAVEDIMVKEFQKIFKRKPLVNIQAKATEN